MKKNIFYSVLLIIPLFFILTCTKEKPEHYGIFFYNGNKLVEFERAQWQQVRSTKNWINCWCPELSSSLSDNFISKIPNCKGEKPTFLVYFNNLNLADIHITKTECDLVLTSIKYREEVIRRSKGPWVGSPQYDNGPIPVVGAVYKYKSEDTKSRYTISMNHFILSANVDKYVYREGFEKGIELTISPFEGMKDAYLISPKNNMVNGIYLLYIDGESAKQTQKKGAVYFSFGDLDSLQIKQKEELDISCNKLKTILADKNMKIGNCL